MSAKMPEIWPPNYTQQFLLRQQRLTKLRKDDRLLLGAFSYYSDPSHWHEFIQHWMITYDPRNNKKPEKPVYSPFIFFPRQIDFLQFLIECWQDNENGLIEKSRDMGATWTCCALSICMWLFSPGTSIGWGSRKQELVDKIGDPDSIFEKLRMLIRYIPREFLPPSFNPKLHTTFMKIINPVNGATITGEVGDNIGRGGRKSVYFKDESAHYERPERIEAALGDNTETQIDISSVNGTANVFARRRKSGKLWEPGIKLEAGEQRVFIMDWRDHPDKTQEWYDRRRAKAEREGLTHIFAQEVDRDYSAAVEGVLIPAIWVQAAIDVHLKHSTLRWESGRCYSGLDVADEGGDLNAHAIRKGSLLKGLDQWAEGDTGQTAEKAIFQCKLLKVEQLHYDSIGVGSGIKAETNRLIREKQIGGNLKFIGWNAGAKPMDAKKSYIPKDKDTPLNEDLFLNLKAQTGWRLRMRFEKTWKFATQSIEFPVEDMIAIPSDIPYFHALIEQLSQPTYGHQNSGKLIIDKKPDGSRSPNLFDSVNIAFNPFKAKVKKVGTW